MRLSISRSDLRLVIDADNSLILGIIAEGGHVRLRTADRDVVRGHRDWLQQEPIPDVVRGFSLLVKKGLVTGLFPSSQLNPGPDPRLEDELITQLKVLLPLGPAFRVLANDL